MLLLGEDWEKLVLQASKRKDKIDKVKFCARRVVMLIAMMIATISFLSFQ